jgi:hypothetical protein
MSDVYLRYEEEPENKFLDFLSKFFELLKNKVFLIILGLIIAVLVLIFILFPLLTTPGSNFVDVVNDNNKRTFLKSDKGSFYAKVDGQPTFFAKKIGNSYFVDLGEIKTKAIKVQTGPYQDFKIFQRTLSSTKDFLISPKFLYNNSFALKIDNEFKSKDFTYEIEALKNDSEFTIYENNVVIYEEGLPNPKCKKKDGSFNVYVCNSSFGDASKKTLAIDIKNKQNKIFVVEEGKEIAFIDTSTPTGPRVAKVDCKFRVEPNIGPNTASCIADGTLTAKVGENSYSFEPNKEVSVTVIGKKGENNFTLAGTDSNNLKVEQNFPFKVPTDFYLDFNPKFAKYDLNNPTDIEFTLNTNENLVFDIYANANGNTKGYTGLNSQPIDTDFGFLNTVDKGVNIDYTKRGVLIKFNTISDENTSKTPVYPEFINVDIVIKNESGQTIKAPCKIYLKVSDKDANKSICE